jgi:hypothetical protein
MGAPNQCPQCGQSGATRTSTLYDYVEVQEGGAEAPRRTVVCQTDRLQCEHCGEVWDEESEYPARAPVGVPATGRAASPASGWLEAAS